MTRMFKEEGGALFDARSSSLGHTLQGGIPSPLDRSRAVRLSLKSMQFIEQHHQALLPNKRRSISTRIAPPESAAVIAFQSSLVQFIPVKEMVGLSDMKHRRGKNVWWEGMKELTEHLAARPQLIDLDPADYAE